MGIVGTVNSNMPSSNGLEMRHPQLRPAVGEAFQRDVGIIARPP